MYYYCMKLVQWSTVDTDGLVLYLERLELDWNMALIHLLQWQIS